MQKNSRLKDHIIYLAGPIQYADDWGVGWRKRATSYLNNLGIGVIDPCDKPTELAKEDENTGKWLQSLKDNWRLDEYSNFLKEVVAVDLRFVDKSDALLVYVNKDVHSCGTYHETAHAFLQRKPVIVFTDGPITDIPGWLYGHGKHSMFFSGLELALDYFRHIHEDSKINALNKWKFLDFDKIFGRKNDNES